MDRRTRVDRRTALRGGLLGTGGLAAAGLASCTPAMPGTPLPPTSGEGVFDCGVASGLHSDSAAVLWTRFAPAAPVAAGGSGTDVEVRWVVASDANLTQVVATGTAVASPESDGCVKVLVEGLASNRSYWYRFSAGVSDEHSPVGRTRTLPADGDDVSSIRLAATSCQNWAAGYYPAWRAIAAADVDAVVFLGDYIYESGFSTGARSDPTGEAKDLASYRAKYRLYRSDADLQAAHRAHPFAPVWDDHEFVNDCDRTTVAEFPERAAAAYRAWFEYQPVWRIDGDRIHRRLRWGRLLELALIDTRQYRDPPVNGPDGRPAKFGSTASGPLSGVHAAGRTLLGVDQRDWFLDGFGAAQDDGVTWKLVANQVMITPIRAIDLDTPAVRAFAKDLPKHAGVYVNFDDWSGFMWERDLVTEWLAAESISNVGFLTGDIHAFWQSKVRADYDDARSPVVAQEFVCGSVSSRGLDYAGSLAPEIARAVRNFNPGFRHVDLLRRGFGLVHVTPERTSVEFQTVNTLSPNPTSISAQPRRRVTFDWQADTHEVAVTRD